MPSVNADVLNDYFRRRYPLPDDRTARRWVVTAIDRAVGIVTLSSGRDVMDRVYVGQRDVYNYHVGMLIEQRPPANRRVDAIDRYNREFAMLPVDNYTFREPLRGRFSNGSFVIDDPSPRPPEIDIDKEPVW
jgi:hypothetical protein